MVSEPILTAEDERQWEAWERACLAWARTTAHEKRVERALRELKTAFDMSDNWSLMWSGGKDSTAMVHLASHVGVGSVRAVSVKDDLDFPGEEEYIVDLAREWGVNIEILHPPCSLVGHITENENLFWVGADIHGRDAGLSRLAFYPILKQHCDDNGRYDIVLGLRAAESRGRNMNRATRGTTYRKKDGQLVCQPIADWADIDVYAYLLSRGIPLLPLYRCVRYSESPGRVRKSWWLPGKNATQGGTIWLRTYYPSLFMKLRRILPQHGQLA